jgi:hypothetical protein
MLLEVVGVDTDMIVGTRPPPLSQEVVIAATSLIEVVDKVNVALADIQDQSAMIADRQSAFDTVLTADGLDHGGNRCFAFLTTICHFAYSVLFTVKLL